MHIPGSRNVYNRVSVNENDAADNDPLRTGHENNEETGTAYNNELDNVNESIPFEPPSYEAHSELRDDINENTPSEMEPMIMEDPAEDSIPLSNKMGQFFTNFNDHVLNPMREKIMDPLAQYLTYLSVQIDFYLNKIGNPLILRRFFYIVLMSGIAWVIMSSGFLPNKRISRSRGVFADHDILIEYARNSFDLSKLEKDLEYISSMPHMSGTKGDAAVIKYMSESFNNNGLKLLKELQYMLYSNYPGNASMTAIQSKNNNKKHAFDLNENNFNPLSANGKLSETDMIYGNKGRETDFTKLKEKGLLDGNYIILLDYDELPSEQMMLAQKYNAKGVIFISEKYDGNGDVVVSKSVGIPQYASGDALTPGWFGNVIDPIEPQNSRGIPHIPSIPISYNHGKKLLSLLSKDGAKFDNGIFSGILDDIKIDLNVETAIRQNHPVSDIIGKVEGREQTDKAIIIAASRNVVSNGAMYPSFGSAALLSLLQLIQEMKYKYDWKPLRNIYFISYGGSEFNSAGATELIEERLSMLKDEVYSVVDISQLGIWDLEKKLNVQTHPVLHEFFGNNDNKMGFDVSVEHVHQYGDWLPFLANGIPVSVISSKKIRNKELPIDTIEDKFENIVKLLRNSENGEYANELFMYLFQISLKLADAPLLPFHVDNYVTIMEDSFRDLDQKTSGKLNFEKVYNSLMPWKRIGMEWTGWMKAWEQLVLEHEEGIEPSLIAVHRWTWNKKLSNIGRRQCMASGLPNRPFYKNVLFSPPLWSNGNFDKNSWLFPAVQDAVYNNDWNGAQDQLEKIAKIIEYSANVFIEETNDIGF